MPIYFYPGYVSKQHYARQRGVQVRTINNWITKRNEADENFIFIKVDGHVCIQNPLDKTPAPEGFSLNDLEWVRNFAERNKMNFPRVYEDIIAGAISGVVLAERVFVIKTEPKLIEYMANYKRKRK